MITAESLKDAITSVEWFRYTGGDARYASSGTTGPDAVSFRTRLPWLDHNELTAHAIEWQRVGSDEWQPTGYRAVMRYDTTREPADDGEGYRFIPYRVTCLVETEGN